MVRADDSHLLNWVVVMVVQVLTQVKILVFVHFFVQFKYFYLVVVRDEQLRFGDVLPTSPFDYYVFLVFYFHFLFE
jgi:hypothetical protein